MYWSDCYPPVFIFLLAITISTNQTNPETKYFKNCAETEQYHASGCLTVDNQNGEFSMKGSICYCETNKCNTNYDANNNNSSPKLNVSLLTMLIISLISFIVSWNKCERYVQNLSLLKKL